VPGEFETKIFCAAREAGLCVECPELIEPLKAAAQRDAEQALDETYSDMELESVYDNLPKETAYYLKKSAMVAGGNTLHEGRQRTRQILAEFSVEEIKRLGQFSAEGPCKGVIGRDGVEPIEVSEKTLAAQKGLRGLVEILGTLIGEELKEPKLYCELALRRSAVAIRLFDQSQSE
jgi:hypothetical protein